MIEPDYAYDMLVIGSGPGGQKAAIQAAKLGKRVAIAERRAMVGGVSLNTGTIPSKTLRQAALYLSNHWERTFHEDRPVDPASIRMADLLDHCTHVIAHETDVIRQQMRRNGVDLIGADARFAGPHTVQLDYTDGRGTGELTAATIVIATGSTPARPPGVDIDGQRVLDSDGILALERIPRSLAIVGAGVTGCEYASVFATLGVQVSLIDGRPQLLPFLDREIGEELEYQLCLAGVRLYLGETPACIERPAAEGVRLTTDTGREVRADAALYSAGRQGATASLNLEAAGLTADGRGLLHANEHYQTEVPHIYAVGDVIGFPSLAATSAEQGRLAAGYAFGALLSGSPRQVPNGVYTIPEIGTVGATEKELLDTGVPYAVGRAPYRELARGPIAGDISGTLKLVFHRETRRLLGVHIIGENAAELVHIGQAVLALGGTVDYFVDSVFNYPTLAEAYKVAALDGINRLAVERAADPAPPARPNGQGESTAQHGIYSPVRGTRWEAGQSGAARRPDHSGVPDAIDRVLSGTSH